MTFLLLYRNLSDYYVCKENVHFEMNKANCKKYLRISADTDGVLSPCSRVCTCSTHLNGYTNLCGKLKRNKDKVTEMHLINKYR